MKFRKKPVVIEAYLWGSEYIDYHGTTIQWIKDAPVWIVDAIKNKTILPVDPQEGIIPTIQIKTLEGTMTCVVGEWIIRGVNGELYPCKPDIFEKTYELVRGDEDDWTSELPLRIEWVKEYNDLVSAARLDAKKEELKPCRFCDAEWYRDFPNDERKFCHICGRKLRGDG